MRLTPPEEQSNINSLSSLLNAKDLEINNFIDVINGLSNIKKGMKRKRLEDKKRINAKSAIYSK